MTTSQQYGAAAAPTDTAQDTTIIRAITPPVRLAFRHARRALRGLVERDKDMCAAAAKDAENQSQIAKRVAHNHTDAQARMLDGAPLQVVQAGLMAAAVAMDAQRALYGSPTSPLPNLQGRLAFHEGAFLRAACVGQVYLVGPGNDIDKPDPRLVEVIEAFTAAGYRYWSQNLMVDGVIWHARIEPIGQKQKEEADD